MSDGKFGTGTLRLTRRHFVVAGILVAGLAGVARGETGVVERDVLVPTPDGSADAILFHPAGGSGQWPAVLLWPDIMGLRPALREVGRRLAEAGYVVLLPNAFYRSAGRGEADVRQRLQSWRAAITPEGFVHDAAAYLAYLDAQPQTDASRKAGTLGYNVGGAYAFRAAAALPDRIGAVASFYGLGVATARPDSPHLFVANSKAAYLVALARNDDAREPQDREDLAAAFRDARLAARVEVYPADHGWCLPDMPAYDPAAAERAWGELLTLFRDNLG